MTQEAGQIVFRAEIDDTGAITGLKRFKKGIEQAGTSSKGLFGDIERLGSSSKSLIKSFIGFGTVGLAGLTAFAIKAPAVADEIAKIEIEGIKLSHTIGSIMEPIFQSLANDILPTLNSFLIDNKDNFDNIASSVGNVITKMAEFWTSLQPPSTSDPSIPGDEDSPSIKEKYGAFAETATLNKTIAAGYDPDATLGEKFLAFGAMVRYPMQAAIDLVQTIAGLDNKEVDSTSGRGT